MMRSFSLLLTFILSAADLYAQSVSMQVKVLKSLKPVSGQEVELLRFDTSGRPTGVKTAKTNQQGLASFRTEAGDASVVARANYQEVSYFSEMFRVGAPFPLEINVYPSTQEAVALEIEDLRLYVQGIEEGIVVSQQFILRNPSEKTFLGRSGSSQPETFRFSIPSSAFDLERGSGINAESARIENNDIILSTPIVPGRTLFALSYKMEKKRGSIAFKQSFSAPLRQISMGVADSGVKPSFHSESSITSKFFDGRLISTYEQSFQSSGIREIDFRISGLPLQIRFSHWLPLVILIALTALTLIVSKNRISLALGEEDRLVLLRELKSLEAVRSQKLIDESQYQLRRLVLLEKLWTSDDRT